MWKDVKSSPNESQMSIADLLMEFMPDILGPGRFRLEKIEADNEGPFVCDNSDYVTNLKLKYHREDTILAKAKKSFWLYMDAEETGYLEKDLQMTVVTRKMPSWYEYHIEIVDGLEI